MKRVFAFVFFLFLFVPAVSGHYYVIIDEDLSYLKPYASEIAELHNGTLVVSNFSNMSFLSTEDYALFIVDRFHFNEGFVYSMYKRLDFDGDGIYDPVVGFLPVWGVDDLVRAYRALKEFEPGRAVFVRYGKRDWGEFQELSENASLIWLEGHGSPRGISMGSWGLYPSNLGDVSGRVFVLESCDVGKIWEVSNPLVMALLERGSPAVVASIDMGGISYLPSGFWASGYPIGKLVQVSNAYFVKVGLGPKVVLFGDPALIPVNSSSYKLVKSPAEGIYSRLFPRVNGHIYTPGKPGIRSLVSAYINLMSIMGLWRGVVTISGLGPIFVVVAVLFSALYLKPGRTTLSKALISATATFLLFGFLFEFPPLGPSVMILFLWTSVAVMMERRMLMGFLTLFVPPLLVIILAVLGGWATFSYGLFVVLISLISSIILLSLFYGFQRLLSFVGRVT